MVKWERLFCNFRYSIATTRKHEAKLCVKKNSENIMGNANHDRDQAMKTKNANSRRLSRKSVKRDVEKSTMAKLECANRQGAIIGISKRGIFHAKT